MRITSANATDRHMHTSKSIFILTLFLAVGDNVKGYDVKKFNL